MSIRRTAGCLAGGIAAGISLQVATYPLWRRWCLTWGATQEEANGPLSGDDLLEKPAIVSTRAVTVDTAPEAIWPWLVQMGPGRGGAYTYDWIENLFGLDMHSADELLPAFQDLRVGDAWRLGRRGPVLRVAALDPQRALVLRSDDGQWVWAFILVPAGTETRLLSRNRIATAGGTPTARAFAEFVMEPGSLIMERKMLLGIKDRAERHPDAPAEPLVTAGGISGATIRSG